MLLHTTQTTTKHHPQSQSSIEQGPEKSVCSQQVLHTWYNTNSTNSTCHQYSLSYKSGRRELETNGPFAWSPPEAPNSQMLIRRQFGAIAIKSNPNLSRASVSLSPVDALSPLAPQSSRPVRAPLCLLPARRQSLVYSQHCSGERNERLSSLLGAHSPPSRKRGGTL